MPGDAYVGALLVVVGLICTLYARRLVELRARMPFWVFTDPPYPLVVGSTRVIGGLMVATGLTVLAVTFLARG